MSTSLTKTSNGNIRPSVGYPSLFEQLRREMDELFDNFGSGISLAAPGLGSGLSLKTDVAETEDALTVTAELPGVEEKDVEVTFDGDLITIKGEKQQKREEKKEAYHLKERSWGSFERVIAVPFHADPDKVTANFEKGVLKLVVPKPPEAKKAVKKIAVQAKK
jgi:HSP20 family protein